MNLNLLPTSTARCGVCAEYSQAVTFLSSPSSVLTDQSTAVRDFKIPDRIADLCPRAYPADQIILQHMEYDRMPNILHWME